MATAKRMMLNTAQARNAVNNFSLVAAQEDLNPPSLAQVYIPMAHLKALSPDSSVVVGMRGAGKSFWTAVLASVEHKRQIAKITQLTVLNKTEVRVGFGQDETNEDFPSPSGIARLRKRKCEPHSIWLAVILRHAANVLGKQLPVAGSVSELCEWVQKESEQAETLLTVYDAELAKSNRLLLVVFDALDRLAEDWVSVRELTRAALRFCLSLRSRKALRLKFFLRPDLEEDDEIWGFSDSSKLRQAKVALSWRAADLYGVVLQQLANSDVGGDGFRSVFRKRFGIDWIVSENFFSPPDELRTDEAILRETVEAITGPLMGKDRKRGYAYTWIPLHLADAKGQVSPRSIMLAFQRAAQWTSNNAPKHEVALHYQGIQDGVAEASKTRTNEIQEDYPWVKPALEAARNLQVPCFVKDLTSRWKPLKPENLSNIAGKLPPRRYTTDLVRRHTPEALVDDLIDLAVLYRTEDGRVNMPDIFRVGVGIKRKGGVRPIR